MEQSIMESNEVLICEAADCFANATKRCILHVGNMGVISVNLCEDCAKVRFGYTTKEGFVGDNIQQNNI